MNSTLKSSLEIVAEKVLREFLNDPNNSKPGIAKWYASRIAGAYERYLKAYREFKED